MKKEEIAEILKEYSIGKIIGYKQLNRELHLQPCYIIKTRKRAYFLKKYDILKFKTARKGFDLLNFLEKKDYPSVRLIKTIGGKSFIIYKKSPFTLWEYLKEDAKIKINAKEANELGKYLGELHHITKNYKMFDAKGYLRYKKMFNESYTFNSIAPERVKNVLNYIRLKFGGLKVPKNQPKAVCHEEYSIQHVLFKNNKLIKIIDWDGVGRDYMFYDLGLTLNTAIKNKKIDFRLLKEIIRGYENKRKLTKWEKEQLFECLLFGAIKYFCWGNGKEEIKRNGWNYETIEKIETLIKYEKIFYTSLGK